MVRRRHSSWTHGVASSRAPLRTSSSFPAGRLATPPESAGILAGITRARLIAAAAELALPVDERELFPPDVHDADEVFISSSIRELLPVVRVDDRTIGAGIPGPVTRALHRRFSESVGLGDRPMPWE